MSTSEIKLPSLHDQRVWLGQHRGIGFKIVSWALAGTENHWPSGAWNFYLYLPENKCHNFEALWLPDKIYRWKPEADGRIQHDYYESLVVKIDLHGGITYYDKHGHTEGFRCVEVGCDYQHLYDEGHTYDENDLMRDAMKAIDSCYELGLLKLEDSK